MTNRWLAIGLLWVALGCAPAQLTIGIGPDQAGWIAVVLENSDGSPIAASSIAAWTPGLVSRLQVRDQPAPTALLLGFGASLVPEGTDPEELNKPLQLARLTETRLLPPPTWLGRGPRRGSSFEITETPSISPALTAPWIPACNPPPLDELRLRLGFGCSQRACPPEFHVSQCNLAIDLHEQPPLHPSCQRLPIDGPPSSIVLDWTNDGILFSKADVTRCHSTETASGAATSFLCDFGLMDPCQIDLFRSPSAPMFDDRQRVVVQPPAGVEPELPSSPLINHGYLHGMVRMQKHYLVVSSAVFRSEVDCRSPDTSRVISLTATLATSAIDAPDCMSFLAADYESFYAIFGPSTAASVGKFDSDGRLLSDPPPLALGSLGLVTVEFPSLPLVPYGMARTRTSTGAFMLAVIMSQTASLDAAVLLIDASTLRLAHLIPFPAQAPGPSALRDVVGIGSESERYAGLFALVEANHNVVTLIDPNMPQGRPSGGWVTAMLDTSLREPPIGNRLLYVPGIDRVLLLAANSGEIWPIRTDGLLKDSIEPFEQRGNDPSAAAPWLNKEEVLVGWTARSSDRAASINVLDMEKQQFNIGQQKIGRGQIGTMITEFDAEGRPSGVVLTLPWSGEVVRIVPKAP